MDEIDIAHLSGIIDAIGSIQVQVRSDDSGIGYRYLPRVTIYQPEENEAFFGKLDAYCTDHGVKYNITKKDRENGATLIFEVSGSTDIHRFLGPMMEYMVLKYQSALIMVHQILPRVEQCEHLNKQGFYELMEYTDELREFSRHGPDSEYTQAYFGKIWEGEIDV